jgi:hypothetical protein
MSETLEKLKRQRRSALRDLLYQCTEDQIALFNRMYISVEMIPDEKIDWAIQQCERTIAKNNKIPGVADGR